MVFAFLAIATAISVNAIHLQPVMRPAGQPVAAVAQKVEPAPSAAERARSLITAAIPRKSETPPPAEAAEPATSEPQPGASQPSPAQSSPQQSGPQQPGPPQPSPLVRAIQKKLAHFGYRALPQDGIASPETRAAILAAEFEQGMPLTGEPTEQVFAALLFLEASGRSTLGSTERFERDPELIKAVQDVLAKLGYTSGPLNGQLDNLTRGAIRRFEADRHMRAEGRLTARILLEMVIEKGQPLLGRG
jgi:peptidoglycan hydrolase-like protein with peptidoglycan-binding domain